MKCGISSKNSGKPPPRISNLKGYVQRINTDYGTNTVQNLQHEDITILSGTVTVRIRSWTRHTIPLKVNKALGPDDISSEVKWGRVDVPFEICLKIWLTGDWSNDSRSSSNPLYTRNAPMTALSHSYHTVIIHFYFA